MSFNSLLDWSNQNPGPLAIILVFLTLIVGWLAVLFKWVISKFREIFGVVKLEISVFPNIEQDGLVIARMKVHNKNKTLEAKNVSLQITDIENKNTAKGKNFIPHPLNWTHYNRRCVDITRDMDVFLDLCQIVRQLKSAELIALLRTKNKEYVEGDPFLFYLECATPRGRGPSDDSIAPPWQSKMDDLMVGKNTMTISVYGKNVKNSEFKILVDWNGGFTKADLKISLL